jgi:hypothetical protein
MTRPKVKRSSVEELARFWLEVARKAAEGSRALEVQARARKNMREPAAMVGVVNDVDTRTRLRALEVEILDAEWTEVTR